LGEPGSGFTSADRFGDEGTRRQRTRDGYSPEYLAAAKHPDALALEGANMGGVERIARLELVVRLRGRRYRVRVTGTAHGCSLFWP
jgi:hypothetical protein